MYDDLNRISEHMFTSLRQADTGTSLRFMFPLAIIIGLILLMLVCLIMTGPRQYDGSPVLVIIIGMICIIGGGIGTMVSYTNLLQTIPTRAYTAGSPERVVEQHTIQNYKSSNGDNITVEFNDVQYIVYQEQEVDEYQIMRYDKTSYPGNYEISIKTHKPGKLKRPYVQINKTEALVESHELNKFTDKIVPNTNEPYAVIENVKSIHIHIEEGMLKTK